MIQKTLTLLFTFLAFFTLSSQAQTLEQLTDINNKYQACLDKGKYMLGCSQSYYTQMDSLLNVAYNKLRRSLDNAEKTALKDEQIKWLRKRDAYFKKVDQEYAAENSNGFAGNDSIMIAIDKKARFVRRRVEKLVIISETKQNKA